MHSRLRRPAVALLTTTLAASVLGIAPAAHAADAVITGTVTGGGADLDGVEVGLYAWNTQYDYWQWQNLYDETDASGNYSITAPEGEYRIQFEDYSGGFVGEAYDNARYVYSPDADTISSTAATPVVANADLAVSAHITGRVTGPGVTGALGDIRVTAYEEVLGDDGDSYWDGVTSERTEADGSYDLSGLAAGAYRVKFDEGVEGERTYATEYYDDAPSLEGVTTKDVVVPAAGLVENIDAQLELDSEITGTVTGAGADGTGPVVDAEVDVLAKSGARWEYVAFAETNEMGEYRVDGLPAGTYRVEFGGEVAGGYASEFWKNVRLLGNATDVVVGDDVTVPQIDAQLAVGEHNSETGAKFVSTAPPTISGAAVVGQTLTATTGSWTTSDSSSVQPTDFIYAWFRGDDYIYGAFGRTYVPTATDIGLPITVRVYADYERSDYDIGEGVSSPTAPVSATAPVAPPVVTPPVVAPPVVTPPTPVVDVPAGLAAVVAGLDVSGKPKVGSTLKVSGLDKLFRASTAVSYKFQWLAGKKAIKKATKSKLKVTTAMKGKKLSVKVTATAASTSKTVTLKVGKVS
ncbi:hypothetical protein GCM10023339_03670 [Alloalcanivorax gelatiniphagus]